MRLTGYTNTNNNDKQFTATPRYIMYCRKSSESDERQIQSLPDQITSLTELVRQKGFQLVGTPMQESKTAKAPGRPFFGQAVQMIEDGLVNGIVLLNPSRLSRNTVDTGRIIYLMDQGKLLEVVTPYQIFRNNPNDKFMLNLLCTQAKLENDNKSVNIKEALRLKAERGVFPGHARPGYRNNHEKPQGLRDISPHPIYFSLMRKLIDLALTGNYSVEKLSREAKVLGIRGINGNPICKSAMHRHLRDPFYTGRFIYGGKLYRGSHLALMTDEEFNLLQDIVEGKAKGRQQKHDFALTGIIKCGECHYCVTADMHTKKYKNGKSQIFAYYHCTKKGKDKNKKCNQPYTSTTKLEGQFASELMQLELDKDFVDLAYEALEMAKDKDIKISKDSFEARKTALEGINRRIDNLIALKISPDNSDNSLLSDSEFSDKKRELLMEKEKITKQLSQLEPNSNDWGETAKNSFDFGLVASQRFEDGCPEDKKVIFKTIGSNQILIDRNLRFQLRFLFLKYKEGIKRTKQETNRLEPKIRLSDQPNLKSFLKSSIWC